MNFNGIIYNFNNIRITAIPIKCYNIIFPIVPPQIYPITKIVVIFNITYLSENEEIISTIPYYISDGETNNYRGGLLLPFICINEYGSAYSSFCPISRIDRFGYFGALYKYSISNNLDFTHTINSIINEVSYKNIIYKDIVDYRIIFKTALNRWILNSEEYGRGIHSILPRISNLLDFLIALYSSRVNDNVDILSFRPVKPPDNYNYTEISMTDSVWVYEESTKKNKQINLPIIFNDINTIDDLYRKKLTEILQNYYYSFTAYNIIHIESKILEKEDCTIVEFNEKYKICSTEQIFIPEAIINTANYSKISEKIHINMKIHLNGLDEVSLSDFKKSYPSLNYLHYKAFLGRIIKTIKPTFEMEAIKINLLEDKIKNMHGECKLGLKRKIDDVKNKYLKYKQKYILLKSQLSK
jgi:hypothetical protein